MTGKGILIVLDAVGIGGATDANDFADMGADTLGNIKKECIIGKFDHIKAIISAKMIILTLLSRLKPLKTDRKSIVDQDSLNITSVAPLGCPFMPKLYISNFF